MATGFMDNLSKSQFVEALAKILSHQWSVGGLWAPNITKLITLERASENQLVLMNYVSLLKQYNIFMKYSTIFEEDMEPLNQFFGKYVRL